jgi:hypothetical protein
MIRFQKDRIEKEWNFSLLQAARLYGQILCNSLEDCNDELNKPSPIEQNNTSFG